MTTTEQFEGRDVVGTNLILTGTGAGLEQAIAVRNVAMHIGDDVHLLIKARVQKVRHDPADKDRVDELLRINILKAETIAIVDAEFASDQIEAQVLAQEKAKGIVRLPLLPPLPKGDIVVTDENGVVLTPAEIAERRGDGRPVVVRGNTPCVVEWDEDPETRAYWPDGFDANVPRPVVGDVSEEGTVTGLFSMETGLPLETMDAFDEDLAIDDLAAAAYFGADLEAGE